MGRAPSLVVGLHRTTIAAAWKASHCMSLAASRIQILCWRYKLGLLRLIHSVRSARSVRLLALGHLDLDLDNIRQEPEAITATSGCAPQKSGVPTLEGRYVSD